MLFELNTEDISATETPNNKGSTPFLILQNSLDDKAIRNKALMNRCFEIYTVDDQNELKMRLEKTRDKAQFNSTCLEMFIAYLFHQYGFKFQTHPILPETDKRPDFLVTTPKGEKFYLEVIAVSENPLEFEISTIKTHIETYKNDTHSLHINNCEGIRLEHNERVNFISFIKGWWHTYGRNNSQDKVSWKSSDEQFKIELALVPNDELKISGHILPMNFHTALTKGLELKGHRYGNMDLPYIIAVAFQPSEISPSLQLPNIQQLIVQTIFGGGFIFDIKTEKLEKIRGFWKTLEDKMSYKNVTGILYCNDLSLESEPDKAVIELFVNNFSDYEVPDELLDNFCFGTVTKDGNFHTNKEYKTKYAEKKKIDFYNLPKL